MEELKGRFHAHITVSSNFEQDFECPKGWKVTVIVLKRGSTEQTDVMITRHFSVPSEKTPDVDSCNEEVRQAAYAIQRDGYEVTRWKLEHESLPTMPVSEMNYRECHIKVRKPFGYHIFPVEGLVESRNPMEVREDYEVVFLNARFYSGSVESVDAKAAELARKLAYWNPLLDVVEVKIESTIYDTNHNLDRWWA